MRQAERQSLLATATIADMHAETIQLTTADGPMALYQTTPDGEARGAVVVIQEAFGVNDHIEDVTRRFAAEGYLGVAPHLFHRTGDPRFGYDDYPKVLEHMAALGDPQILTDVGAAVAHLDDLGFEASRIGVVGFCMGGRATFLVATHLDIGAAVSFYPGAIVTPRSATMPALIDRIEQLTAPWLGLFGDEDKSIPVEDVERLRSEMTERSPVPWEIVRYPGAEHGFHCDARASYSPAAAADGWQRTLAWLGSYLH